MTNTTIRPGGAARLLLAATGGVLVAVGARRRSAVGAALALAGVALLCCALRRGCSRVLGFDCAGHLARYGAGVTAGIYDHVAQAAKEERHPAGTLIEDVVEEASDDSFPCSDPPAWTAR
jgi:uncharacterized membrane protein